MFVAVYDKTFVGDDGFENYFIDAVSREEALTLLREELVQSKSPALADYMLSQMTLTRVGRVVKIVTEEPQVEQ